MRNIKMQFENDENELKYYRDLDKRGLVTHLDKPKNYVSVREMIYILQPNVEMLDMGLKTMEDTGDQFRKYHIINYMKNYLQLCKIMTTEYTRKYGRRPFRLKKKKNDNSDDYIVNKPTTANVYPPDMIDIVEEYINKKPLSDWINEFQKK
jgi:hypothetical protein